MQRDEKTSDPEEQSNTRIAKQPVAEGNAIGASCHQELSSAGSEGSSSAHETLVQDIQVRAPQEAVSPPEIAGLSSSQRLLQRKEPKRKDKDHLHAMRHAVLSRHPLEALARLGENIRSLRRIEQKFRAELKPSGAMGAMLFDRFWSSYLRCVLAARAEATAFAPIDGPAGQPRRTASLEEREVPTLVLQDPGVTGEAYLSADLLRQLALAARYDAHFSREMYRALAMLLVRRSGGEAGLVQCFAKILGVSNES